VAVTDIEDFHAHSVSVVERVRAGVYERLDVLDLGHRALTVDLLRGLPYDSQARLPGMEDVARISTLCPTVRFVTGGGV
jgi:hypothetical protein